VSLWLFAFVTTCAVELVIVRLLLPRARVTIVLAAQLATHPCVWLAMAVLPGPVIVRLAAVEVWAVLVEAAIYARFLQLPGRVALALSAAANAASLLALSSM
jgi:hypothetical protein